MFGSVKIEGAPEPQSVEAVEANCMAAVMAAIGDHDAWTALVDDIAAHVNDALDGRGGYPLRAAFLRVVMARALLKGAAVLRVNFDAERAAYCEGTAQLLLSYSVDDINTVGHQVEAMTGWLAGYEKNLPVTAGVH